VAIEGEALRQYFKPSKFSHQETQRMSTTGIAINPLKRALTTPTTNREPHARQLKPISQANRGTTFLARKNPAKNTKKNKRIIDRPASQASNKKYSHNNT